MDKNSEQYKELVKRMQECVGYHDIEYAHCSADSMLCELLNSLGYTEIVEMYEEVEKWYA